MLSIRSSAMRLPFGSPQRRAVTTLTAGFVAVTGMLQALSHNLIFQDPEAGSIHRVNPSKGRIDHSDGKTNYSFAKPRSAVRLNDHNVFVIFGAGVPLKDALKGALIVATEENCSAELIFNGRVNPMIDYLRAALSRLHCWLLGRGNEAAISSTERQICKALLSKDSKQLKLIGHSAGASTIYSAICNVLRKHPKLSDKMRELVSVCFWGSPEYLPDMERLSANVREIKVLNRRGDYIVDAFEQPLYGGLALPWALNRAARNLRDYGNQHRTIYYLSDYYRSELTNSDEPLTQD